MQQLREYLVAKCERDEKKMLELSAEMLEPPKRFDPYDQENVIMAAERMFEESCTVLQENGVPEPKAMTEFEFYSRLKFYEKKYKKHGHQ